MTSQSTQFLSGPLGFKLKLDRAEHGPFCHRNQRLLQQATSGNPRVALIVGFSPGRILARARVRRYNFLAYFAIDFLPTNDLHSVAHTCGASFFLRQALS